MVSGAAIDVSLSDNNCDENTGALVGNAQSSPLACNLVALPTGKFHAKPAWQITGPQAARCVWLDKVRGIDTLLVVREGWITALEYSPESEEHIRALSAHDRAIVLDAVDERLIHGKEMRL